MGGWLANLIACLQFLLIGGISPNQTKPEQRSYQEGGGRDCALVLPPVPGSYGGGRSTCLQYVDIDEAFTLARHKVGLFYSPREVNDRAIAQLGTAIQETTRILARRFSLSRREIETLLPGVDTSGTEIRRFCAEAGRLGGGGSSAGGGGTASGRGQIWCKESRYRRHDGSCNNLRRPNDGTATFPFKRLLLPQYADHISEPRVGREGFPLPPPRLVSTTVHGDTSTAHAQLISFMFPAWGQLIDHDLTLTAETKDPETRRDINCCAGGSGLHPNCMPISIPDDDPFYSYSRQTCMNFARSLAGVRPGCRLGSRVQINMLTSYIDANFMYGSNYRVADSLRTLQGGQLKTVPAFRNVGLKPILPPKKVQPEDGCILSGQTNSHCFLAGDNRVNEQLALGVLHTLTVREHNRIATELAEINPYWDDETLYQETRHIVAAIVQHITYNEFLPVLLGEKMIEKFDLKLKYQGFSNDYDPSIDATIPASFGTAAFRFGHSLLPDAMEMRSVSHKLIGERKLSEMLQQPFDLYKPGLIDAYVLGMVSQPSQAMDGSITDQVTNHLFQEPSKTFGRDLASINIARAREHGVPGYMAYRKFCGLDDMRTWDDMWNHLPNSTIRHYLHLYSHPDDIDLWSAGVSEFPAPGSMLGPVFSCIIGMTFRDLKRGDRFWYENQGFRNSFTLGQLQEIRKYTLSRMLCNTADNIHTIQRHALLLPDYDKNPRVSCKSKQIPNIDLQVWKDKNYNEDKVSATSSSQNYHKPSYGSYQPSTTETGYPASSIFGGDSSYNPSNSDKYPDKNPSETKPVGTDYELTRPQGPSVDLTEILASLPTKTATKEPYRPTPTAPFMNHGYHEVIAPPGEPKPPGFDQIIYNLVNQEHKNKSQFVVELTDTHGLHPPDGFDTHEYSPPQEKAIKLE
ncbi:Animal haem peroxidase [Nesidiocoris tenuis]|uniref:Animal haem peroxidase n=1 Tax=Nesidiocoris tenuis TaxID=355587 RepID=A0ABN7ABC0_9HEMI|nr:Animal haem peroxidase [Nesidiocoris tenuis]